MSQEIDQVAAADAAESAPAWQTGAAAPQSTLAWLSHAHQRVLVVEDNPVSQRVVVELLRRVGLTVDTADDGERAFEKVLSEPYDLVLMDMQMPTLDGPAAARRIRQRLGDGLPILAMTADAYDEGRQACLAAGMNDYLVKPVDPGLLYSTLLRWLPVGGSPATQATCGPQPGEARLAQRLSQIPGFDVQQALAHVGGRAAGLERILRAFVARYREGEPALIRAESANLTLNWLDACHGLRGSCSVLGAGALPPALAPLELQLRAGADPKSLASLAAQVDQQLRERVRQFSDALGGA